MNVKDLPIIVPNVPESIENSTEKVIVLALKDTTMMDKMKLANYVHTNVPIVQLTDVMNVPKTEFSQKKDVHVTPLKDNTKTEMHFAQIVQSDVKLA